MKDIAIYGFGGFGREVACLIAKINEVVPTWNLIGYFDDGQPVGIANRYGHVIGGLEAVNAYPTKLSLVIAIGTPKIVKHIYENICNPMVTFPNLVAPNIFWYDRSTINMGQGNIIAPGARISCDVQFGDFNILNSGCFLGHDVQIGNFNLLEPETRLSGGVSIGNENFFGARSTVLQYLKIGDNTRIGTGSFVMRNTKDGFLYMGNPAKKIDM